MKDTVNIFSLKAGSLPYSLGIYWQKGLIGSVKQKEQWFTSIPPIFFFLS